MTQRLVTSPSAELRVLTCGQVTYINLPPPIGRTPLGNTMKEEGRKIFRSQKFGGTAAKQCLLDMIELRLGGITSHCGCLNRHVGYQDHQEFYMDGGWESPGS